MTAQHGLYWPLVAGLVRLTEPSANPAPSTTAASTTAASTTAASTNAASTTPHNTDGK